MRLVQIKLHHKQPFWFLDDQIRLTSKNPISDFINIDSLDKEYIDTINKSAKDLYVFLLDGDGRRINVIEEALVIDGSAVVNTKDVVVEDPILEVNCVTVSAEDEPEEIDETEEMPDYSQEASVLLKKNGNTIKKAVKSLPRQDESLYLLHSMLSLEEDGKKRRGVLVAIETAIGEY